MLALIFIVIVYAAGTAAVCIGLVEFLLFLFAGEVWSAFVTLVAAFALFTISNLIARYMVNDAEYEISEFLTNRKKKRRGVDIFK